MSYNDGVPNANLNFLLFDMDYNLMDAGFDPITSNSKQPVNGTSVAHDLLDLIANVTKEGYIYNYLSNENDMVNDVFFDDFKVEHNQSPIVQADDYYPFGLTFNSYKRENSVANNFLYNGKELQEDLDLGWLDYGARMYQPELGRWHAIDPLVDLYYSATPYNYVLNTPTNAIDPDGMSCVGCTDDPENPNYSGDPMQGITGNAANGNGGDNGANGGDDTVYEGDPMGQVTVTANKMSDLEKMRYDTGKDPLSRSFLNGTRSKGRKISYGEGLGYETEFWKDMLTMGEGFT